MRIAFIFFLTLIGGLHQVSGAAAHTALMACFDNGDGTVTCHGAFSDGASAAAVPVQVVDENAALLIRGHMDQDGEFTFPTPQTPYTVIFDAGPGHVVKERSDNITP